MIFFDCSCSFLWYILAYYLYAFYLLYFLNILCRFSVYWFAVMCGHFLWLRASVCLEDLGIDCICIFFSFFFLMVSDSMATAHLKFKDLRLDASLLYRKVTNEGLQLVKRGLMSGFDSSIPFVVNQDNHIIDGLHRHTVITSFIEQGILHFTAILCPRYS